MGYQLERDMAINEIRANWKKFYPMSKDGKGIICPLCGHGKSGDGIVLNRNATNKHSLKCFGCGFSGDILDLVQQDRGLEFPSAVDEAAAQLGIEIVTNKKETYSTYNAMDLPKETSNNNQEIETPNFDYSEYYEKVSANISSTAALSYLQARGITQEIAKQYKLGYDDAWISPKALWKYENGINEKKPYPSKRIIVPMTNNHYLARAIEADNSIQKYNETGKSGIDFFNYDIIKKTSSPVFIVEGAFDALSIISVGGNAIALNSITNADKFLKRLEAETVTILCTFVICLDNDGNENTAKATNKLADGLKQLGYHFIKADITEQYKDANEALVKDRANFNFNVLIATSQALDKRRFKYGYLDDFLTRIEGNAFKPYKTNVNFFDDLLGGGVLRQSILLLLAAPGTGKTTLCQQIAEAMAANKRSVIYFNLEMSREQMLAKAISSRLASKGKFYTATEILQGYKWSEEQRQDIIEELKQYNEEICPYLTYNPFEGADLDKLLHRLNEIGEKSKGKEAPVVVIDYLHLITNNRGLDNQELIKQAIVGLKEYALKYDSFVIAISATGREANRGGKMTINSGRDSSNLEYTGDYMLGLNYAAVYDGTVSADNAAEMAKIQMEKPRTMVLQVLKSRLGEQGKTARLKYDAAYNFFASVEEFAPHNTTIFENKTTQPRKRY